MYFKFDSNPAGPEDNSEAAIPVDESTVIAKCYCETASNVHASTEELTGTDADEAEHDSSVVVGHGLLGGQLRGGLWSGVARFVVNGAGKNRVALRARGWGGLGGPVRTVEPGSLPFIKHREGQQQVY